MVAVHLLRHADAGDPEKWTGPDAARPLSRKGRDQATRLGEFLASVGFQPDAIVTSPKVRAAETAAIVAEGLKAPVQTHAVLAFGFGLVQLNQLLQELGAVSPVLVGHDPDFSDLVSILCHASGISMKKGAMARIDVHPPVAPGSGVLRWLVAPDLLDRS